MNSESSRGGDPVASAPWSFGSTDHANAFGQKSRLNRLNLHADSCWGRGRYRHYERKRQNVCRKTLRYPAEGGEVYRAPDHRQGRFSKAERRAGEPAGRCSCAFCCCGNGTFEGVPDPTSRSGSCVFTAGIAPTVAAYSSPHIQSELVTDHLHFGRPRSIGSGSWPCQAVAGYFERDCRSRLWEATLVAAWDAGLSRTPYCPPPGFTSRKRLPGNNQTLQIRI